MVIFVKSTTRNFALRELIRRTWASMITVADAQLQTIFVLGRSDTHQQALINEEHGRYHDILQVDLADVFRYYWFLIYSCLIVLRFISFVSCVCLTGIVSVFSKFSVTETMFLITVKLQYKLNFTV